VGPRPRRRKSEILHQLSVSLTGCLAGRSARSGGRAGLARESASKARAGWDGSREVVARSQLFLDWFSIGAVVAGLSCTIHRQGAQLLLPAWRSAVVWNRAEPQTDCWSVGVLGFHHSKTPAPRLIHLRLGRWLGEAGNRALQYACQIRRAATLFGYHLAWRRGRLLSAITPGRIPSYSGRRRRGRGGRPV